MNHNTKAKDKELTQLKKEFYKKFVEDVTHYDAFGNITGTSHKINDFLGPITYWNWIEQSLINVRKEAYERGGKDEREKLSEERLKLEVIASCAIDELKPKEHKKK